MARSPVLDLGGDGTTVNNAAMSCRVLYDYFAFHHPSLSNVFYLKPGE